MDSRFAVIAFVATATFGLAGCGSHASGQPGNGSPQSQRGGSGAQLPHDGAPPVANPIDASAWTAKPCEVITNDQLKSAGFVFPGADFDVKPTSDATLGPSCDATWIGDKGVGFTVGIQTPSKGGLSDFYSENKKPGRYSVFKELKPVKGYPAIQVSGAKEDDPATCDLYVGIRNDLPLSIVFDARKSKFSKDPCKAAEKIAGLAIDTMKKGS